MNFSESKEYLYSLGNEVSAMKLGLENIRTLLANLDNPQKNYLKVQVAGTNGKGSVCAFLDAICTSAGIRTGLYTSPHLISITERIKVDGREISEEDFARHATKIRETVETLVAKGDLDSIPTFFEQITAIALNVFAEAKVELTILETGLGGRLDATTAANAEIVAITPIDYDHQEYLGETLAEIAAEKAAIIRPDTKVVLAEQKPEAALVLNACSSDFGISPRSAHEAVADTGGNTSGSECVSSISFKNPVVTTPGSDKTTHSLPISFRTSTAFYECVGLSLLGRHQIENAKVAILLAETLQDHFEISTANIIEGLQTAQHPGRLEYHDNFLFDGAHNIAGAKALRDYLDEFISQPITMIFGSMKGKDISGIAQILFPKAQKLILTKPGNSRAMSAEEISKFVPEAVKSENLFLTGTVAEALKLAMEISPTENLICVTGSLYLVGEAKKLLSSEFKL